MFPDPEKYARRIIKGEVREGRSRPLINRNARHGRRRPRWQKWRP
jgi:hypothetical protein